MSQTILVVDDEANLREMVRLYLEREGFRVVEAASGRDALFTARYEKPDLVLLDLMMPEMGALTSLGTSPGSQTRRSSSSPPNWRKATK